MWTNYMHWLHGLPMWGQVVVTTFLWSFAALLPLTIFAQRSRLRSGRSFQPARWQIVLFFVAAFYVRNSTAWGRAAASWPDRYIPHWRDEWVCIVLAVLAASLIARQIGKVYASMQARGSRSEPFSTGEDAPDFFPMGDPRGFAGWRDEL